MNPYKQTLIQILLFFISIYVLLFGIVFYNSYKHAFVTPESSRSHYWFDIKREYATSIKVPKIVFLSGSNGLFGIRTDVIEKSLNKPVVNYCTHAGLGNYIFDNAKEILNKDDIVILPLEYGYYSTVRLGHKSIKESTEYEYIIGYDYKQLLKLPTNEKLKTISYFIFNLHKFKKEDLSNLGKNDYDKLNKNGDNISYRLLNNKYKNNNKYLSEIKFAYNDDINGKLKSFIQWCHARNIAVYAIAPNINHKDFATLDEKKYFQHIQKFYKQNNVKFLGTFEDGFFETNDMYDTHYHLNTKGQNKRTQYLIKLIKKL